MTINPLISDSMVYTHKYPIHHKRIHIFRIICFAFFLSILLLNVIVKNVDLPLITLKYFTFWGFLMTTVYFGYMVIRNIREEEISSKVTEYFHLVFSCEQMICIIFWCILFPMGAIPVKNWSQWINSIVMHFVTFIAVWTELLINKRLYFFKKSYYIRYNCVILLYLINNFILGYFFQIYPYSIIKWNKPVHYFLAAGLYLFANVLYFLILFVQEYKWTKNRHLMNPDEKDIVMDN